MSVTLGSNNNPNNVVAQAVPSKKDFDTLKQALGKQVHNTIVVWLSQCWWSEENQKGFKDINSKHVIKLKLVLDEKTKEAVKFDFYADKFVSTNVPEDYKDTLKTLTKTEAAAHKVLMDICIDLLHKSKGSKYENLVKDAEKIKSLKDSAAIKVAAYISLQESVWDDPELAHLCDEKYLKMWI